jgi:hypothetical protein
MIFKLFNLSQKEPQIEKKIKGLAIYQLRKKIPYRLVIHHSGGYDYHDRTKDEIKKFLSETGRGQYLEWAGHDITFHTFPNGQKCWCNYHYAVYPYYSTWKLVQLVKYPLNQICWHATDEKINEVAIGICVMGNYIEKEVNQGALIAIAKLFKWYARWLWTMKETELEITGHMDHAANDCPGKIYNQLHILRKLIS